MVKADDFEEMVKCAGDPWYFIKNFVVTFERETGAAKFPEYTYLENLIRTFASSRRLVILKSRQMMVTWTAVAFSLWEAIFKGNSDILFLSKREDDAKEAIRRLRFIFHNLPESFKPSIGENTKYVLEFPEINSRLMALPTHPNIGRTYAPTRIIWDEMACTPFDDEIFASLQPSLDGGGYFVGISTSQGPFTKHAELYNNAESMGFEKLALHYSEHPDKNEDWIKQARKGMSDRQWNMEQEMSLEQGGDRVYETFQKQTHVLEKFKFTKEHKTYRAIDFGFHTPVVLWVQVMGRTVVFFREWVGEDETVSEMAKAIIDTDLRLGLCEDDVSATFCDPAGNAVSDQGISSVDRLKEEYFKLSGNDLKISSRRSSISAGVDLVREKLKNAAGEVRLKCSSACTRTIADFGRYVLKKDTDEPKKDGVSDHTMDTVRYLVINLFQKSDMGGIKNPKPRIAGISRD